ncbi:Palmitoyltransferase PFA4 [Metarhizium anisopliae]|nr:Palmitoyltransferase PFA4 [Metarhizium anisopliae]
MAGLNDAPLVQSLAVPAVCILIAFLGYFSQYLFQYSSLNPGPPSANETIVFNVFLLSLWFTYYKTITEDPGRYVFTDKVIEAEGKPIIVGTVDVAFLKWITIALGRQTVSL